MRVRAEAEATAKGRQKKRDRFATKSAHPLSGLWSTMPERCERHITATCGNIVYRNSCLRFPIFICLTTLEPSICLCAEGPNSRAEFEFIYLDSPQPFKRHTAASILLSNYSCHADCILCPLRLFVQRSRSRRLLCAGSGERPPGLSRPEPSPAVRCDAVSRARFCAADFVAALLRC